MTRALAVITGASSGIGAEFARQLAARGHDVLLIARREDRLRALAGELAASHGVTADILTADLTRDDDRTTACARVATAPNLAVLVNNAGFGMQGALDEADLDTLGRMHRLHILGTLDLTHAALQNFKSRSDAGRARHGIINVSSVAAFEQAPFSVGYCATKAWINSFTKGLAMELSAQGSPVTVQALCPGFTYSEFHDRPGMDRRAIPAMLWLPTAFVVSESLRGFDRGTLIVIPGWQYRWIVRAVRAIPSSWMRQISTHYSRKRRERVRELQSS